MIIYREGLRRKEGRIMLMNVSRKISYDKKLSLLYWFLSEKPIYFIKEITINHHLHQE